VSATGPRRSPHIETEPELRRVTVLFADIQGSTALIQNLDPEQAAQLIDPALRTMIDAVERFDGIASHRGDGIMAIFGAPSASEDHGVRACLAALSIRDALAANPPLRARIGIHVGDVVFRPVRVGRSWSQDAVGIAVHIAARLEQTAAPGTICLSGDVQRFARGFVNAMALEPIAVRGLDVPIERYLLLDADRTANRWGVRAANGLAGFVNRTRELATLTRALTESGPPDEAELRIVQIQGPAGLGKSRLLHQFLGSPAVQCCQVITLIGDMHRRTVPFHPVATWLQGWLGIRSTDRAAEARRKLARLTTAPNRLSDADRDLIGRLLGLGTPGPDIASRGEIARPDFGAVFARLLTLIAGGRRIILIAEDIDCFDAATRELLASALLLLVRHDVLVVTASRTRVRLPVLAGEATRLLALPPLPDEEAGLLLASIDPTLTADAALTRTILRKAGGNPLFLEEVTPLVMRQGATIAARGLQGDTALAIPDRVEALIADRLNRLPRQAKRLVQLCAVIGFDVPLRLIAELSGVAPEELHARLLKLQTEHLLFESRKYPDPQFTFKHALTRDVAYRTILASRRRAHHARIVEILEADGEADRNPDDLCLHALQAQLWPKAVNFLQIAARQAVERGALVVARSYLERAREIAATLPDDDATARIRLDIVSTLNVLISWLGAYPDMAPVLDEAQELADRLQDKPQQARILSARVHMFNILGRLDDAIALAEYTRASARRSGEANLLASATFFAGQSYFNAGKLKRAEATLSENLQTIAGLTGAAADPRGGTAVQVQYTSRTLLPLTHGTRGLARAFLGEFTGAAEDVVTTTHLAAHTGRAYDRVFALTVGGLAALQRRQASLAETLCQQGLALSDSSEIFQLKAPLQAALGHALLLRGELDAASEILTAGYRLARDTSRPMFQISAATGLALASLRLGEPDLARGFADESVEMAGRLGFHGFRVQALRAQGLVLVGTSGLEDEGLAVLAAALALAETLHMRAEIAHGHMILATANAPSAHTHLEEAAHRYETLGMADWCDTARTAIAAGVMPYP
jgi:class 3 adenylate cyclase/tetratricopeptide (TPR) repeat protein